MKFRNGSRIWIWMGLLLTATALVVAGCGDDDEGDGGGEESATPAEPEAPAAPTKQAYIAEADKICKQGTTKGSKLVGEINNGLEALSAATTVEAQGTNATAVANGLEKVADARDQVSKDLEALEAPDAGAADEYLKLRERNTQALRDQAKAYAAFGDSVTQQNSDAATASANKANDLSAEAQKAAEKYGFKECGQPAK